MKCPHCTVAIHIDWHAGIILEDSEFMTWIWHAAVCPHCKGPIIRLGRYPVPDGQAYIYGYLQGLDLQDARTVWPRVERRTPPGGGVPDNLKADYQEACEVLPISSKASAALSRRVLQALLQEQGYASENLAQQVDAVLKETNPSKVLPSSIRESIDAIRNFGNFSAHPITDKTSLQIIDVEPAEAEWCIEIVERLFEHYYVQPAINAKKRADLNAKLAQAGKPPAKS